MMRPGRCTLSGLVLAVLLSGVASAEGNIDTRDWVTISVGHQFTFLAPPGTGPYQDGGRAIDSFVGQFTHPAFKLVFDYGLYSNDLDGLRSDPHYRVETARIDQRNAVVVIGPGNGRWGCMDTLIALYVVVKHNWWTGRTTALQMAGCTAEPGYIPRLRRLFETIRFTSD